MKPIISIILTALFAYALGLYLDWWSIAISAFIVAILIPQKPWLAWFCGFISLLLLWGALAFWKSHVNNNLLAAKVASVLPLKGNFYLLMIVTALVAGLVASFAALAGSYLRQPKPIKITSASIIKN
jgi:hypothetical protein